MVFEKLKEILAELLDISSDEITLESTLEGLGMGNYDLIDMVMSVEDEFSVEIDDDVLEKFETVEDVVNYIED